MCCDDTPNNVMMGIWNRKPCRKRQHFDGLLQDCSNPSGLAMELLQSCTQSSIYHTTFSINGSNLSGLFSLQEVILSCHLRSTLRKTRQNLAKWWNHGKDVTRQKEKKEKEKYPYSIIRNEIGDGNYVASLPFCVKMLTTVRSLDAPNFKKNPRARDL